MIYPIVSVTGTKGKTSIVRALAAVLAPYVDNLLRVDTEGVWLNNRQKFTHQDSKRIWGLAPGNAPGRFMSLLANKSGLGAAILEANLFSSGPSGLGYSAHKVGVFTNVYPEHLGSVKRLQTSRDIAKAKGFIFARISDKGYAVFNADNKYVLSQYGRIPKHKKITKIACSAKGEITSVPADIQIFIRDKQIISLVKGKEKSLGFLTSYKMYIPGFEGSAMNILLILGALTGYFDGNLKRSVVSQLQAYQPDVASGRLVIFESKAGTKVIFDFAHEQKSLQSVATLARELSPDGQIIGVLRLSPTKSDALIEKIAGRISRYYDYFIIYDKVDGKVRLPDSSLSPFRKEKIGHTSKVFSQALIKSGAKRVERIPQEDKALKRAVSLAGRRDVIVFIQGNDAATSLANLQKRFNNQLKRIA